MLTHNRLDGESSLFADRDRVRRSGGLSAGAVFFVPRLYSDPPSVLQAGPPTGFVFFCVTTTCVDVCFLTKRAHISIPAKSHDSHCLSTRCTRIKSGCGGGMTGSHRDKFFCFKTGYLLNLPTQYGIPVTEVWPSGRWRQS